MRPASSAIRGFRCWWCVPEALKPLPANLFVGTSGWSYAHWKDGFFVGVPRRKWLIHCAGIFTGVEVNASYYRFLAPTTYAKWRVETPQDFAFALKGHKVITHSHRLKNAEEMVGRFRDSVSDLGERLHVVLWQLPPNMVRNDERLRSFCEVLDDWPSVRHVIEFRHASWFDDETAAILATHNIANCISDAGNWPRWDAVTGNLAYVRLHGVERTYASAYGKSGLRPWAEMIEAWLRSGYTVHLYFDNDAEGAAPYDALALMELCSEFSDKS